MLSSKESLFNEQEKDMVAMVGRCYSFIQYYG